MLLNIYRLSVLLYTIKLILNFEKFNKVQKRTSQTSRIVGNWNWNCTKS